MQTHTSFRGDAVGRGARAPQQRRSHRSDPQLRGGERYGALGGGGATGPIETNKTHTQTRSRMQEWKHENEIGKIKS